MQQIISNAVSTKTDSTLKQLWQESSRIIRKLAGEMLRSHFGHELWAKTNETFQERKTDLLSKYADSLKWVRGLVPDAAELDSFEKKLQE